MNKLVNGHLIEFTVVLQNRFKFEKVIKINLNGRLGCAFNWTDALEYAREVAAIETEWQAEFPIAQRLAYQEYVSSGRWEAECFKTNECA
jgi:hypothetical protein